MSSSEPPGTKRAEPLGQARASFDWIELLAVPIALSVMETQPIALALTFLTLAYLDAESITLLLLGLHWWARAVSALQRGRLSTTRARLLRLLGLLLAIAITVITHIALLNNLPALFFYIILIIGFWYTGMYSVQKGPNDEYVLTVFKIGLGVLLGILILEVLNNFGALPPVLRDELTYALPTFFLSGLIALSFTRIMMLRKENANAAQRGLQGDPTRGWLLVLTLAWIVVVVSTLALETFGFQSLVVVATLLWSGLGTVTNWILLLLSPLLKLIAMLFISAPPPPRGVPLPRPAPSNVHLPSLPYLAEIRLIIGLILLAMLLVILFFVIREILRRWHPTPDDESEEEIRENLSRESILKTRREQQRQRQKSGDLAGLEPLYPNSARARYRELLQELAFNGEKLARRAEETASEYEKRLLALLKEASSEAQGDGTPTDPSMLGELTEAYMKERYGGKRARLEHDAYAQGWIPRFVGRLANSRGDAGRRSVDA